VLILKKFYEMDKMAKILSPTYNECPYRILEELNNEQLRFNKAHTLTSSTSGASSHSTRWKLIDDPNLWSGPWEAYVLCIFLTFSLQTLFRFTDLLLG
jgi:hypothetical protein